jgi:hypothetical protein
MARKKHYVMTCAALFFLGLIVMKPRSTFYPAETRKECRFAKIKWSDCGKSNPDSRITSPIVYEYD